MNIRSAGFQDAKFDLPLLEVRGNPAYRDPDQIQASVANWNRHIGILDQQLAASGRGTRRWSTITNG
ncbi:hypothetical protein [Massilia horti]|uniref:Uncharacterized protein n=1 Tax=Massilia horti TaxID=2562153 RepID=A0A4Y9SSK7_9BURK|nr:hypothetical protein [Massilia horti]TFW27726.1 hypothetical protein E4O92_22965 [Massilia horti]